MDSGSSDVKFLQKWRESVEANLDSYAKDMCIPYKTRRKFTNAISTVTHNVTNGMPFIEAVKEAIEYISTRVHINSETVANILLMKSSYKSHYKQKVHVGENQIMLFPEFSTIRVSVSKSIWLQKFPRDELIKLYQRYGFMHPNTPFYWSIHPSFYQAISIYNTIEGFASPFSKNLRQWCSRYPGDRVFGALGDFFDVIKEWEDEWTLWVINPPYTLYLFTKVLDAVKQRRLTHPKDEYIFLLPVWEGLDIYNYVQSCGKIYDLKAGTYKIFEHSTDRDLSPPVDMAFGYIGEKIDLEPIVNIIRV